MAMPAGVRLCSGCTCSGERTTTPRPSLQKRNKEVPPNAANTGKAKKRRKGEDAQSGYQYRPGSDTECRRGNGETNRSQDSRQGKGSPLPMRRGSPPESNRQRDETQRHDGNNHRERNAPGYDSALNPDHVQTCVGKPDGNCGTDRRRQSVRYAAESSAEAETGVASEIS